MTFKRIAAAFALAAGFAASGAAPASAQNRQSAIPTYGTPIIIPGLESFCRRMPDECAPPANARQIVAMTPAIMRQLDRVNREANSRITYAYDEHQYGRGDYWAFPDNNIGDCEDYALDKRRTLLALGWPPSALLIATARTETGEGHAVLVARTTDGDFILDNRYDTVRHWQALPYRWVALQNPASPRNMRAINNGRGLLDILAIH